MSWTEINLLLIEIFIFQYWLRFIIFLILYLGTYWIWLSDINDFDMASRDTHIESAPKNSNETYTFMCLGRAGRFGREKYALKLKYEI